MQTMKWIEMVRLGPTSPERSSTFDSDKVRVRLPYRVSVDNGENGLMLPLWSQCLNFIKLHSINTSCYLYVIVPLT